MIFYLYYFICIFFFTTLFFLLHSFFYYFFAVNLSYYILPFFYTKNIFQNFVLFWFKESFCFVFTKKITNNWLIKYCLIVYYLLSLLNYLILTTVSFPFFISILLHYVNFQTVLIFSLPNLIFFFIRKLFIPHLVPFFIIYIYNLAFIFSLFYSHPFS